MAEMIYQLNVTLRDVQPPIWRRFQVRGDISFRELHHTLQVVMGWTNSHLHQFLVGAFTITTPLAMAEWGDEEEVFADGVVRLDRLLPEAGVRFFYEYDFGDSWVHLLDIEQILPVEETAVYPRCLTGARACPPEDCGGVGGYVYLLEALADPAHEEHDSYLEWLGGDFDPEAFDLAFVNRQLREGVFWQDEMVMPPLVSRPSFTPQGRSFWSDIPEQIQNQILSSVWCPHCRQTTTIVNFKGNIEKGDLLLRGECARCGGAVARVLEGD